MKSGDVVVCHWMMAHHGEVRKPVVPNWNGGSLVTAGSMIEKQRVTYPWWCSSWAVKQLVYTHMNRQSRCGI